MNTYYFPYLLLEEEIDTRGKALLGFDLHDRFHSSIPIRVYGQLIFRDQHLRRDDTLLLTAMGDVVGSKDDPFIKTLTS